MDYDVTCETLALEVARFATLVDRADSTLAIPTCPEWTAHDLAKHLGTIHRWANHLVRVRATERISPSTMEFDRGPVSGEWLQRGGIALVATLARSAPDDAMWAWGADQHVRFWARRQLHETFVHRLDLELALDIDPVFDVDVAVDAIDEHLANLAGAAYFSPNVARLRGDGESLRFVARDASRRWDVRLLPDRFEVGDLGDLEPVSAEIAGSSAELLYVITRRRPLGATSLRRSGNDEVIERWLEFSALE